MKRTTTVIWARDSNWAVGRPSRSKTAPQAGQVSRMRQRCPTRVPQFPHLNSDALPAAIFRHPLQSFIFTRDFHFQLPRRSALYICPAPIATVGRSASYIRSARSARSAAGQRRSGPPQAAQTACFDSPQRLTQLGTNLVSRFTDVPDTFSPPPSLSSLKSPRGRRLAYPAGKGSNSIRRTIDAKRRRVRWLSANSSR